jgi:putative FmdB family regulatory protein
MPLYVYACETCGHGFEIRQRFGDDPLSTCPECAGHIRRVVQPVGIVFKGSGFYKTDSRSASTASVPSPAIGNESGPAKSGAAETASTAPAAPTTAPDNASSTSSGTSAPKASGGSTKAAADS